MTPSREYRPANDTTVAAGYARGLLDFAVSRGAERAALFARSGLRDADLADQEARLPLSVYGALMRAGKALTGDSALALHFGEEVDTSRMSIVGSLGRAAPQPTIAQGFAQLNRFAPLMVDVECAPEGRWRIERGDAHWLVDTRRNPNDFPELTETAFARLVCGMRARFPDFAFAEAVHLTFPDPGYAEEYARIFRAPVTFDGDRNAIRMDRAMAAREIAQPEPYVGKILRAHAETLLGELAGKRTMRGRVERQLGRGLAGGVTGMDQVASRLGLSRRTLARRLREEGVTYEAVLDALRCRLALDQMEAGKLSIAETSHRLGFSDPAAFSRAFKRWTGMSPSALRTKASPERP